MIEVLRGEASFDKRKVASSLAEIVVHSIDLDYSLLEILLII